LGVKRVSLVLLALAGGCAPQPTSVPLGVGPLAVQERDAELAATTRRTSANRSTAAAAAKLASAASAAKTSAAAAAKEAKKIEENATTPDADGADGTAEKDSKGADTPAFPGLYAGQDVAIFRLTGFPERTQRDDKAKIRIKTSAPGVLSITLINSENGTDLCELAAKIEGKAALLEPGQPCFQSEGEGAIQAEITSGRAVLEGDRLSLNAAGTLAVDLGDQDIGGELSYSFKGERQ
jgi:hypothetical protein